jgi:hypothetical protein
MPGGMTVLLSSGGKLLQEPGPPGWRSHKWDSKIWSWVPRYSDSRKSALARTSNNWKIQTRPLVRENAHINNPITAKNNYQKEEDNLVAGPRRVPDTRQTGRLTVGRNITSTLTFFGLWRIKISRFFSSNTPNQNKTVVKMNSLPEEWLGRHSILHKTKKAGIVTEQDI